MTRFPARLPAYRAFVISSQWLLQNCANRLQRQKQLQRRVLQGNKAESLIVCFGGIIFGIHEQTDATHRIKNFEDLLHCSREKQFSQALAVMIFRNGQAPQFQTRDLTGKSPRQFLGKVLGFQLADVQREITEDGFGFDHGFRDKDKSSRDAAVGMLTSCVPKIGIERLVSAIEALPIVRP